LENHVPDDPDPNGCADYVSALQRGDVEALRASFSPDATWSLRGDLPVSGTWTGPEQILDTFLAA
jgi:ketosteroid isomerase-like protein